MTNEEQIAQGEVFRFLGDTSHIFNYIKKYSILVEEILPAHKAPVHPANELKSLAFHLYNSALFPTDVSTNILEAKEHLCRAFYDLHNIIISAYIEKIRENLTFYKRTTLANSFPEYANTIRPAMRDIQADLREIRTNRNTDIALLNTDINTLTEQVTAMARFDDIVESMQQEMNLYEAEQKRKNIGDKLWDVAKILIGALVGAVITYFIISHNSEKNRKIDPQIINRDSAKTK
ncbi:MAG: hypothetical protein ABI863_03500 [Ginsengibacter sp.]